MSPRARVAGFVPLVLLFALTGVLGLTPSRGTSLPRGEREEEPDQGDFGYFTFSQSTLPHNQVFYCNVATKDAAFKGLYRTRNGGTSWEKLAGAEAAANDPESGDCQCAYDQTVGVDPQDAERVYIAFQQLYRSTDGGETFVFEQGGDILGPRAIGRFQLHWDHHFIQFAPRPAWSAAPTQFWVGTDGGITTSPDGGNTWTHLNTNIGTNLFLEIAVSQKNGPLVESRFTYGGTQDCGTIEHRPDHPGTQWHLGTDGDGSNAAVDPFNPLRAYGITNFGILLRTQDGGRSWSQENPPDLPDKFATIATDPNQPRVVYVGGSLPPADNPGGENNGPRPQGAQPEAKATLYQSVDMATTFQPIEDFPASITAIVVSRADSRVVWVALNNGEVWRTPNANADARWVNTGAPGGANTGGVFGFTKLALHPTQPQVACAVYKGFTGISPSSPTKHVFLTVNGGQTWRDVSGTQGNAAGNLPDLPVNAAVFDTSTNPYSIIVGTDAGVMRTLNGGRSWQVLGLGLPLVCVKSLAINPFVNPPVLRAGTYGRSVFEIGASTGQLLTTATALTFTASGQEQSFSIRNVGVGPLAVNVAQPGSPFTLVGDAGPRVLTSNETQEIRVRFTPQRPGRFRATLRILSGDPRRPVTDILLTGTG